MARPTRSAATTAATSTSASPAVVKRSQTTAPPTPPLTPLKREQGSSNTSNALKAEDEKKPQASPNSAAADRKIASLRASLVSGPFPTWARPTPEEATTVAQLLATAHGYGTVPKSKGSTAAAYQEGSYGGCGNVANVLDALIRTVLSCNTSGRNSKAAHKALCEKYGKTNWKGILEAPKAELAETIRCGGLHERKAGIIQGILQRTLELHGVLSLDHLHGAPSQQVMEELVAFNGVGPKVASCCSAFCIGNDELAVDTHVYRLCKNLGWVPEKATRDQTYYHLAERVPTELKYGLHVLLIRHGKSCSNCSAKGFAVDKAQYLRSPTPPDGQRVKKEGESSKSEEESATAAPETEQTERVCVLKANGLLGSKGKNKPKKEEADVKPKVEKEVKPKVAKAKKEAKVAEDVKEGTTKRESVGPEGERRSKRARQA